VNQPGRKSKIWSVVRVTSGNFLEMYDFMIFGYYASAIGSTFFPGGSAFAWLMKSLMTFGAGCLWMYGRVSSRVQPGNGDFWRFYASNLH
jgi:hypothetical protein